MRRSRWLWLGGLAAYAFLYAPLAIVVGYSFNDSSMNAQWVGFTLDWYRKLFRNEDMLTAAWNSLVIGLTASAVSTVLGTMAGYAMYRYRLRLLPILVLAPIAIPEILMGVSLLLFFVMINVTLGMLSITLAHIAFCIGFVAIVVRARLAGLDESLTEAARDLGATPRQAFRLVTLPLIMPGVVAGALMAFTLSIDDFVITFFTSGPDSKTLPLAIYTMVKITVTPEVNAVSTLLMLLTLVLIVVASRLSPNALRGGRMRTSRLLLLALALALSACGKKEDVLHLYNWNQYIASETVQRFEQFCGCRVQQTFYSDNSELMARITGGAKGYDVLVPTSHYVLDLANGGYLQRIDKGRVPNLKNIDPVYLNTEFDPDNTHSVPYAYTITMLGYNDRKMRELGVTVDSWAVIFDPTILEKIKSRITVLDSPDELMAAALKYLGHSVNDREPAHWEEAKQLILKAKPYWAAFKASGYIELLAAGDIWIAHGYSSDLYSADLGAQQAKKDFRIRLAMPKEGAVIALDAMVIPKDAPRPDLAHTFINFMLEDQNSADLTNMLGTGNPNAAAMNFIKPEIKAMSAVFPDQGTAKKLEMPRPMNPEERRRQSQIWTEIKAE